jgi:hypothetical protein
MLTPRSVPRDSVRAASVTPGKSEKRPVLDSFIENLGTRKRSRSRSGTGRLLLLLAVLLIAGCAAQSAMTTPDNVSAQLVQSGFDDPAEVEQVLAFLKDAADQRNLAALSGRIRFPLTLYDNGKPAQVFSDASEVLKDPRVVFSDRVLLALSQAQYTDLFVRDQGAMIGDGEVWLGQYPQGVMIKAINP